MRHAPSSSFRSQPVTRVPAPYAIASRRSRLRALLTRAVFLAATGAAVMLVAGGTIAATGYMLFRDSMTAAPPDVGQPDLRQAYERRIAELQAELHHAASRQALGRAQMSTHLRDLLDRQDAIAARQRELAERQKILTGLAGTVGIDVPAAVPIPAANPIRANALPAMAIRGTAEPAIDGDEDPADSVGEEDIDPAEVDQTLGAIERSLDDMRRQQVAVVQSVSETVADRNQRLAAALTAIGARVDDGGGVGGPYEPLGVDAGLDDFRDSVDYLTEDLVRFDRLTATARRLPLARPLPETAITSRFGRRRDPFLGRPAMHTGLDFRAPQGETVRATAPGKVTIAGRSGGYGNMVEIDHGNGLRTRYGHMSRILVRVGQKVGAGDIVGKVGSTGRSTGPHLHYEVRRAGKAVDPMTYLRAGADIRSLL